MRSMLLLLCFVSTIAEANLEDITKYIYKEAELNGVDPQIAYAIAKVESGLDPLAIGDDGQSYGLFQVKCDTAKMIGFKKHWPCKWLFDHKVNTKYGLRYLKVQIRKYGIYGGIAAYNSGKPYLCKNKGQIKKYSCKRGQLINKEYVEKVRDAFMYSF